MDYDSFCADLRLVQSTLNLVSVSGADNLNRMLGCMIKIEELIKKCEEEKGHDRRADNLK